MSTRLRLAGFVTGLFVVFGLATVAGGFIDPIHELRPETPDHVEVNH